MGKKILWHIELPIGTGELAMAQKIICKLAESNEIDKIVIVSGSDTADVKFTNLPENIKNKVELKKLPRIAFDYSAKVHRGYFSANENVEIVMPEMSTENDKLSAWHRLRMESVMSAYNELKPDMVVVSYWPEANGFIVDEECTELLGQAKKDNALTVATSREIILADTPPQKGTFEEAARTLATQFDKILIHSDPKIISFCETFSDAYLPHRCSESPALFQLKNNPAVLREIENKISYTGYVTDATNVNHSPNGNDFVPIIVSTGLDWHNSASYLHWAALAIAEHSSELNVELQNKLWNFFISPKCSAEERILLNEAARGIGEYCNIKDTVSNFSKHQQQCAFSFQNGGIATFAEMVRLGKHFYPVPVNQHDGASAEQKYRLQKAEELKLCTLGDNDLVTKVGNYRRKIQEEIHNNNGFEANRLRNE